MTEPPELLPEAPSARDAPPVIHLPPPPPVREPYRPRSGSEKRQRQHVEQFRTDDAEHAELQRRAWDSGRLSVSAYCRKRALGDPGVRHARGPAPPDIRLLAQNFGELNRVGNNLNQTVRALNELVLIARETGNDRLLRIAGEAIERNRLAVDELRVVMAENRRALGHRDREG
jgi:Mobilization protein NikA